MAVSVTIALVRMLKCLALLRLVHIFRQVLMIVVCMIVIVIVLVIRHLHNRRIGYGCRGRCRGTVRMRMRRSDFVDTRYRRDCTRRTVVSTRPGTARAPSLVVVPAVAHCPRMTTGR